MSESNRFFDQLRDDVLPEAFQRIGRYERVEAAMLGTLLACHKRMADMIACGASEEWFTLPLHRALWNTMLSLSMKSVPFDFIVVQAEMIGPQSSIGPSLSDIAEIFGAGQDGAYLRSYARCLRKRQAEREAVALLAPLESEMSAEEYAIALSSKASELSGLSERVLDDGAKNPKQQIASALAEVDDALVRGVGLKTGLYALDGIFRGWRPGEIIVCGARPSVGKSALAVTVADYVLRNTPDAVVFFASIEMRAQETLKRLFACRSQVSTSDVEDGIATEPNKRLWREAVHSFESRPCYVEHKGMADAATLRASATSLRMRLGRLDLVIIDHLHHMRHPKGADNANAAVTSNLAEIVSLAHDVEAPVLVLAQMNRGIETRDSKEPELSDLRDSGTIEQVADIAFFLHRPDRSKTDTLAFVRKNRRGSIGTASLKFNPAISRFFSVDSTRDSADILGMR